MECPDVAGHLLLRGLFVQTVGAFLLNGVVRMLEPRIRSAVPLIKHLKISPKPLLGTLTLTLELDELVLLKLAGLQVLALHVSPKPIGGMQFCR